ncbi:MAG TPA: hypothetical protein VJ577_11410 [Burkholderiaceae bacterium]|nr:hypothetical protein [Burkholderiaceae bacterium]
MAGPTLQDLQAYSVNRAGQMERIKSKLYDTVVYATAGATNIAFFSTPIGQGASAAPGNAGNVKTLADTNMTLAGQLPAGQNFLVESIEVDFKPGSSAATTTTFALVAPLVFNAAASAGTVMAAISDVAAIYNTGYLTFTVGSKNYVQEGPLGNFPPMTHLNVNAAVASTSATVGQTLVGLARAEGKPCNIDPVTLVAAQNFSVTASWPVVVATPSGFNGSMRVNLGGYLFRNSQ